VTGSDAASHVDPLDIDVASAIVVERSLADVTTFVLDPANLPKWLGYVRTATWETPPPVRLGSRLRVERSQRAGARTDVYEVCELAPGEQVSWRTIDDEPLTMTFAWRAVGERVTHMTLRYHVRGTGRWTAAAARVVMRRSMTRDLARLKKTIERDPTALR
jgi:hypothetical protein